MSDPLGLASYVLMTTNGDLANSRKLTADSDLGVTFNDFGPGGNVVFGTVGALAKINELGATGIVISVETDPYFVARSITSDDGSLTVTNGNGADGNIDLSLGTAQSVQLINFQRNGVAQGAGSTLNLVAGSGVNITPSFNGGTKVMTYTLTSAQSGTVTSVGLSSSTGLTIGSSPVTGSGTITVNLPSGTAGQFLSIASTGPQVLDFVDLPELDSLATFLCQTDEELPTNGINLGAAAGKMAIGFEDAVYSLDVRNVTARAANDYTAARFTSQTAGAGSDFAGIENKTILSPSSLRLYRGQGTIATPTLITGATTLGEINFGGAYADSSFATTAQIVGSSTQAFTEDNQGSALRFRITKNNTNTTARYMIIDQTGFVGIGDGDVLGNPVTTLDVYSENLLTTPIAGLCALNIVTNADAGANKPAYALFTNFGGTGATTAGSNLGLLRARNSAAAPRRLVAGDEIASVAAFGAYAADNTTDADFPASPTGQIKFRAGDEDFTAASQPTAIDFYITHAGDAASSLAMIIDQTGYVGIGEAAPTRVLDVYNNAAFPTDSTDFVAARFVSDTANAPDDFGGIMLDTYGGYSSLGLRGSAADQSEIESGDILGTVDFYGYTGSGAYKIAAEVRATATENFSNNTNLGSRLDFYTTPDNTSALNPPSGNTTPQLSIDQNGYIGVNQAAPENFLHVYGDVANASDYVFPMWIEAEGASASNVSGGALITNYNGSSDLSGGTLALASVRGTKGSPTAILEGDILGKIEARGGDETGFFTKPSAQIYFSAAENFVNDAGIGGKILFITVPVGTDDKFSRMTIDSTGFVGIGTSGPDYPLEVYTATNVGSLATIACHSKIDATGSATCGNMITSYTDASSGGSSNLFRTSRGTADTPNPVSSGDTIMKLLAFGNGGAAGGPESFGTTATASISAKALENFDTTGGNTNKGTGLTFETTPSGSTTRGVSMAIQNGSANPLVGIGIASPVYNLDLYAGSTGSPVLGHFVMDNQARSNGGLEIDSFTGNNAGGSFLSMRASRGSQASSSETLSGDVMGAISVYGNGSTNTTEDFSIEVGAIKFTALENFNFSSTDAGTSCAIITTPTGSATPGVTMDIRGGGGATAQVGIGMVPTTMLELVGSTAQKSAGTAWTNPSDERLKTDITDIDGETALSKIKAMKPRTFKFTEEYVAAKQEMSVEDVQYGFIAQELETVFPESVKTTSATIGGVENVKTVDVSIPNVVLFKAVQALIAKVDALEAQLANQ